MKQTVLLTGAAGQLGRELAASADESCHLISLDRSGLDIGDSASVERILDERQPNWLINAAAYTAVDRAESDTEAAQYANGIAPGVLARACAERGVGLVHVSTDFVFAGTASEPYRETDATGPLGVYGRSKLAGEQAVLEALPGALIVRTGWVYSRFGNNFVKTMLRLMAQREALSVVADQVGTPTWAQGLAEMIWAATAREAAGGLYHWSDAGVCSWYDLAVAVYEEACTLGLLEKSVRIRPIPGSEYPTAARRPAYSVLDKTLSCQSFGVEIEHWRIQLRHMLRDLKEYGDE